MKLTVNLNPAAKRAMHEAAANALQDIVEDDLGDSQNLAPIEEGTLIRSGFTEVDRKTLQGQVAFDTPYAIRQHEDPTLQHDAGRKDHFLEDTVEQNRARHIEYLQQKVAGA
ncbi:hypothetical protein [Blastococcus sp. CT_GayMR16]|uniref:hypothetical protein n=1 Tax=Blastococcus sp. CT_GayMR16 TaxID=2559607 RepID=UPI00107337BA|nr:hypothetical protein [Blastococcus sp. CT_GayMR16]TFV91406.1 hypothetical protein E4P38_02120 [Blastococcus sp. CT_GayMR16]